MLSIGNTLITNEEMAARTAVISTMDIWNVEPTISRRGCLSHLEEVAVDMSVTNEDDGSLMETEDRRATKVEIKPMIKSALHVSQVTTTARRMETMVQAKVDNLLENACQEAAKGKKRPVY